MSVRPVSVCLSAVPTKLIEPVGLVLEKNFFSKRYRLTPEGPGWSWEGHGRVRESLGGSGRVREGPGRVLGGSQEGFGGCGRILEGLGFSMSVREGMVGFVGSGRV